MMKSIPLLTVILIGLSFTGSPQAVQDGDETLHGQWALKCFSDPPVRGECGVYWATPLTQGQEPSLLAVAVGVDDDKPGVRVFASYGLCASPVSSMHVDGHPPVPLWPFTDGHAIPDNLVDETFGQFNNGTMLFLRVHMEPDCALSEYPIPLPGFSEAWSQIPR